MNRNIYKIEKILDNFNIKNYTINSDETIDVDGSVNLSFKNIHKLEIQFNKVMGNFSISGNPLTTMKGFPKYIEGILNCNLTCLETLEYFPEYVGDYSFLNYLDLKSLDGYTGSFNKLVCDNKEKLVRKYKLNNALKLYGIYK